MSADGATINGVAGARHAIGGRQLDRARHHDYWGRNCLLRDREHRHDGDGLHGETGAGSFVRRPPPRGSHPRSVRQRAVSPPTLTGTAASLTAGTATVANGLKSATPRSLSAPRRRPQTAGTDRTAALRLLAVGPGSVSITSLTPNIVVAPSPITGTGTVSRPSRSTHRAARPMRS